VTDQWLKFGVEYPHMMSLGIVSVMKINTVRGIL